MEPVDHVALDRGWMIWRWACLRATGFPVRLVRDLANDELARCADHELAEVYQRVRIDLSRAIRTHARDPRLREAITWQNRRAIHSGIDWLLRQPADAGNSTVRKNELLIARYLQRYCVKSDTIGFFGPVGWARFSTAARAIDMRPGRSLLATRTVYYEYWAIDAIAAKLARDPRVRPFAAPRLLPQFRIDGTMLRYGAGSATELSPELAEVAARCDGVRGAREIARDLAADETSVFELLDELVAARAVRWTFEIPTALVHPERHLAALVDAIEDDAVRRDARGVLDKLDARRDAVAAAHDAVALDAALAAFDATFTELADVDSYRAAGQAYAGRTPLYEDCRRDLELELGAPVIARLAAPLALVLDSARWFTYEIAARYRRDLAEIYRRLRAELQADTIGLARFWRDVPALFPGAAAADSHVARVRAELQQRWATILEIDPAEHHVRRRAAALADAVHRSFAAPGPGWPQARHQSPDLLVAARDAHAIERGDFQLVLGELHAGFNTVIEPLFLKEHPRGEELVAARDSDIARPCIAPVWSKAVSRGDFYSSSSRDFNLESGETRSARPRSHVLATSELVVVARDGFLEVTTRDGSRRFDIVEFLEHHLIAESFAAFSLLPPAPRRPRVSIDDLVIARATWRLDAERYAWAKLAEPTARFAAARRWIGELGIPRFAFARTPEETKPIFVDFHSIAYVELLAKHLRAASAVAISEMLPTVDDAWIVDTDGERYVGELRVAAVDPCAWKPDRTL